MDSKSMQNRSSGTWFLSISLMVALCCGMLTSNVNAVPQASSSASTDKEMEAAWEYRPYKVVVWVAHDNSWRIKGMQAELLDQIETLSRLADRSGWAVQAARAPNPWNWRLISDDFDSQLYSEDLKSDLLNAPETAGTDKLIVVRVTEENGLFVSNVQEFDLRTQVWGARVARTSERSILNKTIFDSIATAFMPVARIENVLDSDVRCRVRASGIAHYVEKDENGEWQLIPNTGSPVWINDEEILMPVILRKDRRGNLESIKPIFWTYLSIEERNGPNLECKTHAMRRAPLGGRTGGRTERLGLCVRAPSRETTLKLISNDKQKVALPDLEVYSRRPGQEKGTENEFIGKTDWRGEINVPPNEDPMRILLIKSGRRPLARVPVVPGLYDRQMTSMPNDEHRLYAEGITRGLFNELMDHVALRQLTAERIRLALERPDFDKAESLLNELRDIPDSEEFKRRRLNIEKQKLLLGDKREKEFIAGYFLQLENAASEFLNKLDQNDLERDVRDALKK